MERASQGNSDPVATIGEGDMLGVVAMVSDKLHNATARSVGPIEVLELHKARVDTFLDDASSFKAALLELASKRSAELEISKPLDTASADRVKEQQLGHIDRAIIAVSDRELKNEVHQESAKGNSALAIWLGIVLDGIPESLVIGMLVVTAAATNTSMSIAFIIGVFLANLPEALSSAVTMKAGGMKTGKISMMWGSLCLLSGIGAFIGAAFFPANPEGTFKFFVFFIEGLAAGAMLTMIAETILPEAFEQGGGPIAGLSTLVGFLAALSVKLIHTASI